MLGLGYDGDLFILAFDHRGSFVKKFFGIEGTPSPEDALRIADAKTVIYEGFQGALEGGVDRVSAGDPGGRAVRRRDREARGARNT